jgi:hypothetical protein
MALGQYQRRLNRGFACVSHLRRRHENECPVVQFILIALERRPLADFALTVADLAGPTSERPRAEQRRGASGECA